MLNKSLILSAASRQRSLKSTGKRCRVPLQLVQATRGQKYVSSARSVTTSPNKTQQQVARRNTANEEEEEEVDSSLRVRSASKPIDSVQSEKYQIRLRHLNLWHSIDTIKRVGHRLAQLDPLRLKQPESLRSISWSYPLIEQLKSSQTMVPTSAFLGTKQPVMSVNELIDTVYTIYAGQECGLEFAHMSNQEEVEWLTSEWEKLNEIFHLDPVGEQNLAKLMLECEAFDHFMAAKFPTTKRYGCEGAESMLAVFDEILHLCHLGEAEMDEMTRPLGAIDNVIIGMPHRGRLNLLACLLGFEPEAIFSKAAGEPELDLREAQMAKCDVLSHLSTNVRFVYGLDRGEHIGLSRDTPNPINVSLLPNPSHLELASPMVAGAARGRAHNLHHGYSSSPRFVSSFNSAQKPPIDHERSSERKFNNPTSSEYQQYSSTILPIQVHGDAALAGQGVIQETLQMANLPMFNVGGSLHLVVNNHIGFTTESSLGRSSRYCTDIFKMVEAPIIHVNAENLTSVIRATRLALSYRQKFGKDVAIDLICYRQHGHNEMDEPAFTQPVMYSKIRNRKSIPQAFCDKIGLKETDRKQISDDFKARLQDAHKKVNFYKPNNDNYRNFSSPSEFYLDNICRWQTGCDLGLLRSIALASVETPEGFHVHPNLERVLIADRKLKYSGALNQVIDNTRVDWATAEIMAFGSLLKQNQTVRICGQDVARGTFSTRHAVLVDQQTEEAYIPLNNMQLSDLGSATDKKEAKLEIANSILSEEAVLAYEFGYSVETCALTIWEAQFGDFFNTAQSALDTLISSSESKWLKQSPLTLLLPHGLDGAGPEHSSSHLERFLQMSSSSQSSIDTEARVNWSVCFPTLPSQYFHLLRRQLLRPFRKPLVIMSPKAIFRHPGCSNSFADFGPDQSFEPVLDDPNVGVAQLGVIDTLVLCTGKVYFQLDELRAKNQLNNVALIRIEELCPFPVQALMDTIKQYPNVRPDRLVWFQEEHKNQGAFSFVDTRMQNLMGLKMKYIGRPESELPAVGCGVLHRKELEQLTKEFKLLARA